jgi:putative PEP-CTERM system histidine kinase
LVFNIQFISFLAGGVAFSFLAVLVALSRTGGLYKYLLLASCVITVFWAMSVAGVQWFGAWPRIYSVLDIARNVSWLLLLGSLLGIRRIKDAGAIGRITAGTIACVSLGVLFAEPLSKALWLGPPRSMLTFVSGGHIVLSVIGLLALENLYRNAEAKFRWAIKYFCFGLGTILGFDFFFFSDAALFGRIDMALFDARGFVNALVTPLLAIAISRATLWEIDIHLSRTAVFHSAALVGSGIYLIGMAASGFYLKEVGGEWGRILQILFLASALLILLAIFSSASLRAKVKVSISKHFFSYKYDYREEWLRFIQTVASDDADADLHARILRSIADITQSNSGGLWLLRREDNAYLPASLWHMNDRQPAEPAHSTFIRFLDETHWVVDLDEYRQDSSRYRDATFPSWLVENKRNWLVVPLIYRDLTYAFLVLGDPRVRRGLDWEDFDLLRTVGHQAASYLAEQEAMNDLSDARRLEDFNRRSAFIVHDKRRQYACPRFPRWRLYRAK